MKSIVWAVIIVVIAIVIFALFGKYNSDMNPSSTIPNPTSKTVSPNNVSIENFSFNPQALTVKVGAEVTWINNDSTIHDIKSSTFNSAGLNAGDTFKFTFSSVGTYDYNCGIHPVMTGKIIVQ